jgi:hypothetical protein
MTPPERCAIGVKENIFACSVASIFVRQGRNGRLRKVRAVNLRWR